MVPSVSKEKSISCGAFFWLDGFYEVLILRGVRFKINTEIYLTAKRHHIFKTANRDLKRGNWNDFKIN